MLQIKYNHQRIASRKPAFRHSPSCYRTSWVPLKDITSTFKMQKTPSTLLTKCLPRHPRLIAQTCFPTWEEACLFLLVVYMTAKVLVDPFFLLLPFLLSTWNWLCGTVPKFRLTPMNSNSANVQSCIIRQGRSIFRFRWFTQRPQQLPDSTIWI